ncbi:MAG: nitroreductase family protein [Christensenellaceae bacterium]|jgi:nitroreductase|nr:nitroreductase family protein [Christensenellaceae bacterium]
MKNYSLEFDALVKSRRSTRKYNGKLPSDAVLASVIAAGRYAPSGFNSQGTHIIVVKTPAIIASFNTALTAILKIVPLSEKTPPMLAGLVKQAQTAEISVTYGAPVVILVASKTGYVNAVKDTSCVMENMQLAATANCIGSCWINFFGMFGNAAPLKAIYESIGLQKDEEVQAALVLGESDDIATTSILRENGNPVTFA